MSKLKVVPVLRSFLKQLRTTLKDTGNADADCVAVAWTKALSSDGNALDCRTSVLSVASETLRTILDVRMWVA